MFVGLLGQGFAMKCKLSMKFTKNQIDVMRRKRKATKKFLKKDIADMLANGLDVNAYERELLEQINTTADRSDYLWYSSSIVAEDIDGAQPVLHIESLGHVLHDFINGKLARSGVGNIRDAKVKVHIPITLVSGKNKIDPLGLTAGLQNYGAFYDLVGAGITGPQNYDELDQE